MFVTEPFLVCPVVKQLELVVQLGPSELGLRV